MNSTLRDADYYTLQFEKSQHGLLTTSSAHALSPLVKLTPRHEAHSRAEFGLSDLKSGRGAGVRDQFLMRWWPGATTGASRKFVHWCCHAVLCFFACLAAPAFAKDTNLSVADRVLAPLEAFQDCAVCPEMIVLPMGRFIMGAPLEESREVYLFWNNPKPDGEPMGMEQEGPEHEVVIDIPIAMGRNEVTREEWMACVEDGGCSHTPDPRIRKFGGGYYYADDPRHPVMDVSYLDMLEYTAWLNQKTGTNAYRLPTEAEWEYAARAGTQGRFAQGDTLTLEQANIAIFRHADGTEYKFREKGERYLEDPNNRKTLVLVDMLDAANAWGLRHMSGNVLELTMSCWTNRHLGLATSSAYLADAQNTGSCKRVPKGGSVGSSKEYARPANRGTAKEFTRSPRSGFRIVKELE